MLPAPTFLPEGLAKPATGAERRTRPRYAARSGCHCQIQVLPDGQTFDARPQNLSTGGIAVLADRPLNIGDRVRLFLTNDQSIYCLITTLTVLRVGQIDDEEWFVAGEFERSLGPAELTPFFA